MTRLAANGAIVSEDGHWWWTGRGWEPLSRQATSGHEPDPMESSAAADLARKGKLDEATLRERAGVLQLKAPDREAARSALHATLQAESPLPIHLEDVPLPGGFLLREDEFVVGTARDWEMSTQNVALTTQRLICPSDPSNKTEESVSLVDVRDVTFRKHLLGFSTVSVETADARKFLFPAHANGARAARDILAMVQFAQQRAHLRPHVVAPVAAEPDKYDQLRKLAELRASGVLSDAEFDQEKAKILKGT